MNLTARQINAFHKKYRVLKSGCWEWFRAKNKGNYGLHNCPKECRLAHRVSWVIYYGEIPNKLHVLHKCDNPPCVNPDHLFLGTDGDNAKDMIRKNRQCLGVKRRGTKLTVAKVLKIKKLLQAGESRAKIADKFSVSTGCIAGIAEKRSWKTI